MTDKDGFLRALQANPADDLTRLVYADWLEEQGTEEANRKAEFLRAQHELRAIQMAGGGRKRKRVVKGRLVALNQELPAAWLGVVSHLPIENCAAAGNRVALLALPRVEFECPKDWAGLAGTDDPAVRFCAACQQNVYFCETIAVARDHAGNGHCVAVHAALPRSRGDLEPIEYITMGLMLSDRHAAPPAPRPGRR